MARDSQSRPDVEPFAPIDPYALSRREQAASQLKRFYKMASVEERGGVFLPLLDGRPVKTPARKDLRLPTLRAAQEVADEWNRQSDTVLPGSMPFTRLVNTALDGVATTMGEVQADIVRFAASDLLCYRAEGPAELVERQTRQWDPVLAWSRETLGARFALAQGVMFVDQPAPSLAAIDRAVERAMGSPEAASLRLASLHLMTTLTGSALLALAVACGAITAPEAWAKAHVDEDFQTGRWGEDAEAMMRRAHRWADMAAAARLIETVA